MASGALSWETDPRAVQALIATDELPARPHVRLHAVQRRRAAQSAAVHPHARPNAAATSRASVVLPTPGETVPYCPIPRLRSDDPLSGPSA